MIVYNNTIKLLSRAFAEIILKQVH